MNESDIRQQLNKLRDFLLSSAKMGDEAANIVELDQGRVGRLSRMDAMQAQAVALDSKRRREISLTRIEAALKRLDEGSYGWCLRCDDKIAEKRLQLDPAAPLCIKCASKNETRK